MSGYNLHPRAAADLDGIADYVESQWGAIRAKAYMESLASVFRLIADFPAMGSVRVPSTPPVRLHVHRMHVILYREDAGEVIEILRVMHGRSNWATRL